MTSGDARDPIRETVTYLMYEAVADKVCHAVFGVPLSAADPDVAQRCRRAATLAVGEMVQQVAVLVTEQKAAYAMALGY